MVRSIGDSIIPFRGWIPSVTTRPEGAVVSEATPEGSAHRGTVQAAGSHTPGDPAQPPVVGAFRTARWAACTPTPACPWMRDAVCRVTSPHPGDPVWAPHVNVCTPLLHASQQAKVDPTPMLEPSHPWATCLQGLQPSCSVHPGSSGASCGQTQDPPPIPSFTAQDQMGLSQKRTVLWGTGGCSQAELRT